VDRTGKQDLVASLHRALNETAVLLVTHYSGLTVAEMTDLRIRMRQAGAGLKVAKNRLVLRAIEGTPFQMVAPLLKGPTALAYSGDPVAAAKVAVAFAKTNPKLILLGGGLGRQMLDAEGVKALASLPSLDDMRATLIGLINAPATRIAGVLQAPAGQLARVFAAYSEKDEAA
jgi:large subunit ribosomal protein L10